MEVNEAMMKLGKIGRYQVVTYIGLCIFVMFPSTWHMFAIVYIGYKPDHRCRIGDDDKWDAGNASLPMKDATKSSCLMFVNSSVSNQTQPCDNGWIYDPKEGPTIITEWNLVCDRDYMNQLSQTLFVIGVMFGSLFFGSLADNFGRKPVFLFSHFAMLAVGTTTAFITNLPIFFALRFLAGALQQGIVLVGFVMICELFATQYRPFAGIMSQTFWASGISILPLWAYLIPNWRYFQLAITCFSVFTVSFIWLLSESIPWLYANGRVDEAEALIRRAATINRIDMPQQILKRHVKTQVQQNGKLNGLHVELKPKNILKKIFQKDNYKNAGVKKYSIIDIFRSRIMLKHTVIMSYIWMVLMLVYYGLSLNVGSLAGNRFVNGFINFIVEIPIYIASYFAISRFGRRRPVVLYTIISGTALILTYFIPKQTGDGSSIWMLRTGLYILGKMTISGSIGIGFLYTQELFPIMLKSQALGICSFCSRFGNILATFIFYLTELVPWLTAPLLGILSFSSGACILFLPETLNRSLPQTIDEIDILYQPPSAVQLTKVEDKPIEGTNFARAALVKENLPRNVRNVEGTVIVETNLAYASEENLPGTEEIRF